jgi:hypothetical protein
MSREGIRMQLELTEEETEALRHLLDGSLVELRSEIHDTDNVTYRQGLSHYRETLRTISTRLTV